jgi:hypothetical protein
MAQIQKQFEEFHEAIKLKRFVENATLREKRNIIRGKLTERLPAVFEDHEEECPEFDFRDQGSYEMGTGIKPLEGGEFDIDQGIYFKVPIQTYQDPVVLKQRVYEALDGHTRRVEIRRPCVTVFYQLNDEPVYHVDLAVYSDGTQNPDGKARIAKGKENSTASYRVWEVSNPQALTETIFDRFQGSDRDQFRRIVRYLKRWKDENFPSDGHAAPLGIGLTIAVYDHLQPSYSDQFSGIPDDLSALCALIPAIIGSFGPVWDSETQSWKRRLSVCLPVEPWSDLFEQMTDNQMLELETKLKTLNEALQNASRDVDPIAACEALNRVFGSDFPVPLKESTGKWYPPAISSSSNSA